MTIDLQTMSLIFLDFYRWAWIELRMMTMSLMLGSLSNIKARNSHIEVGEKGRGTMALSILVTMLAASAADRWWKALIFGLVAALATRSGFLWYLKLAGAHQSEMAIAEALAQTAMTAVVISPVAYIFAQGRGLARRDKQQTEPRARPGPWRAPREATPLISERLGWPAWAAIGIGLSALIGFWAFTPGGRDRWVRNDGAIACHDATEIEDIQSMQSVSSRRYTIEDLVTEKKCVPLFADDRVRIRQIGEDGSKVRVVLESSGHSMWMQLSDLKPNNPTLLTMPWRWKEELPTATGPYKEAKNPFDKFHAAEEMPSKLLKEKSASVDESVHFVLLTLPRGVELHVPKSWWLLGSDLNNLIGMSAEAVTDLSGLELRDAKEVNLIAANSTPASTYAALRVDSSTPPFITPNQMMSLSSEDISEFGRELRLALEKALPLQGNKLKEFFGTRIEKVSNYPALVSEYRRTGLKGPVRVQIYQVATEKQELRINLSYRESEAAVWKPVIAKIRQSITIRRWP